MSNLLNTQDEFDRMNRMLDRMFGGWARPAMAKRETGMALPVDVFEKNDTLYVRAAVPGLRPEDLDVDIEEGVLTIKGDMKKDEQMHEGKVYICEYSYGTFTRSIRLPDDLDLEKVEAKFENGFVTVSIPRTTPAKPNTIKVPVKSVASQPTIESKPDESNDKSASQPNAGSEPAEKKNAATR